MQVGVEEEASGWGGGELCIEQTEEWFLVKSHEELFERIVENGSERAMLISGTWLATTSTAHHPQPCPVRAGARARATQLKRCRRRAGMPWDGAC